MKKQAIKNNLIAMWDELSLTGKVYTTKVADTFVMECQAIYDPLFNYAIDISGNANLDYRTIEYYMMKNKSYFLWTDYGSLLDEQLKKSSFNYFSTLKGMLLNINNYSTTKFVSKSRHSSIKVEIVKSSNRIKHWIKPIEESFGLSANDAVAFSEIIQDTIANQPNFYHLIGSLDNKVISSLILYGNGEIAGFYNGATLSNYRKQGALTHLILVAIELAKAAGYKDLVAQAGPQSSTILSTLGFETQCDYNIYASPNSHDMQRDWQKR